MTTPAATLYRVSIRLWVVFSLLMALSAAASGLVLLYLARPYITGMGSGDARQATVLLFTGAALSGATAAVAGLVIGLRVAGRIRRIVRRADALSRQGSPRSAAPQIVSDELGALDAAVGRLSMSMDRFVRDSDILARLPEGMLLLGPGEELLSYNATAEVLLELGLDRYRGTPLVAAAGPLPAEEGNEVLSRRLEEARSTDRPVHVPELAVYTAQGKNLLVEMTVQHRQWKAGSSALVVLLRDASEKQRIREEIRRADQLAFLGGMAARVAHEIRTPLATVRGLVELLQQDLPAADQRRAYIDRLLLTVDRQDRMVEDLLTLSHPEPESWQEVSLPALVADVVGVFPRDPRVIVSGAQSGAVPPAWGDPFRLGEVLTNLVKNALEAAPADGIVEIRTEPGGTDWVRVKVRNTGSGIPKDLHERIFQPFFTTKSRGTGLGLAIARQVVEAHRGRIHVESDGQTETTFIVQLPTTASCPPRAGSPSREGDRGE